MVMNGCRVGSIPAIEQPNFRSTYVQQFNLALGGDFRGTVVRGAYFGMLARHIVQKVPDFNALALNNYFTNKTINVNAQRPYYSKLPLVTSMPIIESNGAGSYNALQLGFDRRPQDGLNLGVNYTYAHNLNDALTTSKNGSDGCAVIPSQIGTVDYGNIDLDQCHRLNATVLYSLPFGSNLKVTTTNNNYTPRAGTTGLEAEFPAVVALLAYISSCVLRSQCNDVCHMYLLEDLV
jgi:hypothetical protein